MIPETAYDSEKHEMTLDVSTSDDAECSCCDVQLPRGELIVFYNEKGPGPLVSWLLCIGCARKKLLDFLPVWEERHRCATVTT